MAKNTHDFEVALQPIMTLNPVAGKDDTIAGRKAVIRQDNGECLGILSDNYALLKHADVIDAFRKALAPFETEEKIQIAKGGAHLFATYKLNAVKVEVRKDDMVSLQFVVKNSYDGSSTLQIMLGAYRLVCENGMIVGQSFFNFSQKHVGGSSDLKVEVISERIGNLIGNFHAVLPRLQEMSRIELLADMQDFDGRFSEKYFGKESVKGMPAYLIEVAREEFIRAADLSLWGYYNALTYAISHAMKKESPVAMLNYGKVAWATAQKYLPAK